MAEKPEPLKKSALHHASGLNNADFETVLGLALTEGLITETATGQYMASKTIYGLYDKMTQIVMQFHQNNPLKLGIPREELRSRLGIKQPLFIFLLG
ncbi:MAG TPA: DNA/RNA-binding winged helix domain-containing protein, partial [Aggregatilineales bacterium]|nr:DNA/RNA-binding winged helix domain-containing protein [Aggregatilineales bacterium]